MKKGRLQCSTESLLPQVHHKGEWEPKTWNGLDTFEGDSIWTDGLKIYHSLGNKQYVLNGDTWEKKTWRGLTEPYAKDFWTDGTNIYYSDSDDEQYVLNGDTWEVKTWNGNNRPTGRYVWSDGTNIYYDAGFKHYVLNGDTWEDNVWNGYSDINGEDIWFDGTNIYFSDYSAISEVSKQYVLNGGTWEFKTWGGFNNLIGAYIWSDGTNYYYSNYSTEHYILNDDTWKVKEWKGLDGVDIKILGTRFWTDGTNIYYSSGSVQRILKKVEPEQPDIPDPDIPDPDMPDPDMPDDPGGESQATISGLITDRTSRNVVRRNELAAKGWERMTDAERAEWLGDPLATEGVNLLPLGSYYSSTVNLTYKNTEFRATATIGGTYLYAVSIIGDAANYENKQFTLSVDAMISTVGCAPQLALYWHDENGFEYAGATLTRDGSVTVNLANYPNTNGRASLALYVYVTTDAEVAAGAYARFVGVMFENGATRHEYVPYTEILPTLATKGAYNYSDLNRVERAVKEISDTCHWGLTTKTDWAMWDIPRKSDMKRYLDNVKTIALVIGSDIELPDSMDKLTYVTANNIEKVLYEASKYGIS